MKSKQWWCIIFIVLLDSLLALMFFVYEVVPYFHYHKPNIDKYYYELDNQRTQNNGIVKNFDYDALFTGASVTDCFKTSEMDSFLYQIS